MADHPPQLSALAETETLRDPLRPRSKSRARSTSAGTSASGSRRTPSPVRNRREGGAPGSSSGVASGSSVPAKAMPRPSPAGSCAGGQKGTAKGADAERQDGSKWNIAVINFGGRRNEGEEAYVAGLYGMPAWVICATEMDGGTLARLCSERDIWEPAPDPLHLQFPPQGFVEENRVQRWTSSGCAGGLAVIAKCSNVEETWYGEPYEDGPKKRCTRMLPVRVRFRKVQSTGQEIRVLVFHLHHEHAKENGQHRKSFYEKLTEYCAGGTRLIAGDANLAVFGMVPEMRKRGVQLTLAAVHSEYDEFIGKWKWDTMGLWAVGPVPDPGLCMPVAAHAAAALLHPRMEDVDPKNLAKGWTVATHARYYATPDPDDFVTIDVVAESERVEGLRWRFPKGFRLARGIDMIPWAPVVAPTDIYDEGYELPTQEKVPLGNEPWRLPGPGPYPATDHLPPMPRLNEALSDCLKWDPLGHRWGRGAHWPLIVGIGMKRERSEVMREKRKNKQRLGHGRLAPWASRSWDTAAARAPAAASDWYAGAWNAREAWRSGGASGSWENRTTWENRWE